MREVKEAGAFASIYCFFYPPPLQSRLAIVGSNGAFVWRDGDDGCEDKGIAQPDDKGDLHATMGERPFGKSSMSRENAVRKNREIHPEKIFEIKNGEG